jgi:hypothetical protein
MLVKSDSFQKNPRKKITGQKKENPMCLKKCATYINLTLLIVSLSSGEFITLFFGTTGKGNKDRYLLLFLSKS